MRASTAMCQWHLPKHHRVIPVLLSTWILWWSLPCRLWWVPFSTLPEQRHLHQQDKWLWVCLPAWFYGYWLWYWYWWVWECSLSKQCYLLWRYCQLHMRVPAWLHWPTMLHKYWWMRGMHLTDLIIFWHLLLEFYCILFLYIFDFAF